MPSESKILKVKDHSVSGETFELKQNSKYNCLETHPRPGRSQLQGYYKSKDYISHTGAKRNLFELAYHTVRGITLRRKIKLIESLDLAGRKLLDVGCGTGDFLKMAKESGWLINGAEPNDQARKEAARKLEGSIYKELEHVQSNGYSVITLWHVLEHLPDLEEKVHQLQSLLKLNGRLIVAVPNYKSFDAAYYKEFWAAYDAPRHLWHFSKDSIKTIFQSIGMEVEEILPMKFDAYYVSLLSEKYKSGWMNFFNAFFVATRSNLRAGRNGEYSSLIYVIKNVQSPNKTI